MQLKQKLTVCLFVITLASCVMAFIGISLLHKIDKYFYCYRNDTKVFVNELLTQTNSRNTNIKNINDKTYKEDLKLERHLLDVGKEYETIKKQGETVLLFSLLIALALSFTVVLYLINFISKNLSAFKNASLSIREGNLDIKLDEKTNDEFGALAVSFNSMVKDLKKSIENEKKIASLELQAAERAYFKNYVENLATPFYVIDIETYKIVMANKATHDFGDFNAGTTCHSLVFGKEEVCSNEDHTCLVKEIKRTGKPFSTTIVKDKSNEEKYYNACGYPVFNKKGKIIQIVVQLLDITEQVNKERKLDTIINTILTGLVVIDKETQKIVQVNSYAAKIFGKKEDEIVGNICHNFICPAQVNNCPIMDLGQEVDNSERVLLNSKGDKIPIIKSVSSCKISGKEYLIESFVDISEYKKAVTELKESESRLKTISDSAKDAILMMDSKGNISFWNPAATEILGYSYDEAIGKELHRLIAPERFYEKFKAAFPHFLKTGQRGAIGKTLELPALRKDGKEIPVELSLSAIKIKNEWQAVAILRDITERKEAEEKLLRSNQMLNFSFEASNTGPWWIDLRDDCEEIEFHTNDFTPTLFGLPTSPTKKIKTSIWRNLVTKTSEANKKYKTAIDKTIQDFYELISGKREYLNNVYPVLMSDGNIKWILSKASVAERKKDGAPALIIGTVSDVTEQIIIQEKFKEAKEAAEAASKAKSEFLSNMSHELRTPLNGVIGFADLLNHTELEPQQKQYLNNVTISANALLSLISDILDFSKIEAGKLDIEWIKTDIRAIAEEVIKVIRFNSDKKEIELLLDIQNDIPELILIDPLRIKQILINLLDNAVKFTEKGEVELKITFDKVDETVGEFGFFVRDTGIGIPENKKYKLFNSFSQVDGSTTRKFGGTGLGLAISYMLASKMGEPLKVISEVDKGSTFYFTVKTEYMKGSKYSTKELQYINKVLIVDDNRRNCTILEHIFKFSGIKSVSCESGETALKILDKSDDFDVVILDYQMPGMNGMQTAEKIRENEKYKNIRLILCSSCDTTEVLGYKEKSGIPFIIKPITSDRIYQAVAETAIKKGDLMEETAKDKKIIISDKSEKILVAEDVAINMLLTVKMLKKVLPNVEIVEAVNGIEAFNEAKKQDFDLILSDVQMPGMDGLEFTEKFRKYEAENKEGKHVPVIALTAAAFKSDLEKCQVAGMDDFITKPITFPVLKEKIEKFIFMDKDKNENSGILTWNTY